MKFLTIVLFLLCIFSTKANNSFFIITKAPYNKNLEFKFIPPSKPQELSQILLIVGGRNWQAEKTLNTIKFNDLAVRHNLLKLSVSFKDDEYWDSQKWSGNTIFEAISYLYSKYKLKDKILIYGYSAGAQFTWDFTLNNPNNIQSWAMHANGVWSNNKTEIPMGLVTCGAKDSNRFELSRNYVQKARENGAKIAFVTLPTGHELDKTSLSLAEEYFNVILSSLTQNYAGDDQTYTIIPWEKRNKDDDFIFSFLPSKIFATLWQNIQKTGDK